MNNLFQTINHYFTHLKVFHTSISWWLSIGVWVTANLLKSPGLSILADLNNAVVWMASTHPLISKSSSLCTNPLVMVPSVLITVSITIIFMFQSFFSSLVRSRYYYHYSYLPKLTSVPKVFVYTRHLFCPVWTSLSIVRRGSSMSSFIKSLQWFHGHPLGILLIKSFLNEWLT